MITNFWKTAIERLQQLTSLCSLDVWKPENRFAPETIIRFVKKIKKKKNRSEMEKLAKMSCDTHLLHGARKLDVFTSEMISKAL